ncbi:MAG: hypothetical protein GAK43_01589 [Stenotrophomonas maltophilia]|nr:MAG: hypothetical protein GAK43_01589 [Stenotrophomonas maltophilia]
MVGGDVVRQDRQRAHAAQRALTGQGAFPVRRATDVGGLRAPVVQRAFGFLHAAQVEHRDVHLAELLGLDAGGDDGVDLFVRRPQVLQRDRGAATVLAEHVLLDIETHAAGDGVGHHQRRRGEEGLLGVGVDAPVEVAVAREYGSGIEVAVDDFLLDRRFQRAGHAVTGGAGIGDDAEAELFQLLEQAGFLQVQPGDFRARREGGLHPGLAHQAQCVGFLRQQAGSDHVARVAGVGATGDGGNDHRAIGHQPGGFFGVAGGQLGFVGDAALGQGRGRQAAVRVGRAGHIAHHAAQVEAQHAFVLGALQRATPQAEGLGVGFDQRHLLRLAAGESQVIEGLLVDVEHRRGGAVLRAHVGDGRAVADRQAVGALAEELDIGPDHALLAQVFGEREDDIGGGDARLATAAELDADDVRQAHHRRVAEHHGFRFQATDADGDHAQRVNVRGVRIGAHAGIGEGHAVAHLDHRAHFLQVDLVHDAVAGGDHIDVLERGLGPLDEVETVLVAAVFDGAVLLERVRVEARGLDGQRVVDDQLGRHHRVDLGRVTALFGDGIAQAGQVDQRGLPEDVMADHARRVPGEVEVTPTLDQLLQRGVQALRFAAAHQLLGEHARGVGEGIPGAGLDRLDRRAGVEVIQRGAGQAFTVLAVHDYFLSFNATNFRSSGPV